MNDKTRVRAERKTGPSSVLGDEIFPQRATTWLVDLALSHGFSININTDNHILKKLVEKYKNSMNNL